MRDQHMADTMVRLRGMLGLHLLAMAEIMGERFAATVVFRYLDDPLRSMVLTAEADQRGKAVSAGDAIRLVHGILSQMLTVNTATSIDGRGVHYDVPLGGPGGPIQPPEPWP